MVVLEISILINRVKPVNNGSFDNYDHDARGTIWK